MGDVIIQEKQIAVYWSNKLSETQENHHTMEYNPLFIAMIPQECLSIFLALKFSHIDHKNLHLRTFTADASNVLVVHFGRVWVHNPLSPWQKCHCQYIFTVANYRWGEYICCQLQLYLSRPWYQQQSWLAHLLPQFNSTKTATYPNWYFNKAIGGHIIVCYAHPNRDHHSQWKYVLTKE